VPLPVPVASGPPHDCQLIPVTVPVGSPPSEIAAGSTCPKPTPDGPKAPDAPSAGELLPPPRPDEPVVGAVFGIVVVVVPGTEDVEVVPARTAGDVAVPPTAVRPA
jgi:hypothetical protein